MKSPEARDYYPTQRRGINRRSTDRHIRNVMLLVLFTVIMAALTCIFAYFFDQVVRIDRAQTPNHSIYLLAKLIRVQGARDGSYN